MSRRIYPLLSGGIDSTVATLRRIQKPDFIEIKPIFIDYGQKARIQEWSSVRNVSQRLAQLLEGRTRFQDPVIIELATKPDSVNRAFAWSDSMLITGNSGRNPYLENRNMVLLSIAASYVESQIEESQEGIIVTGFRDEFPDTKREFVGLMNCLFSFLLKDRGKTVTIEAPVIEYGPDGKSRLLEDFKNFKEIIDLTWSCYDPKDGKPCRTCGACTDRKQAFEEAFRTKQ
jgi:7-cyano-7-deazaguanine synthase